jgi:N-acetylneuraminic acid mutarotase
MKISILLSAFLFMAILTSAQKKQADFKWGQLPAIPDEHGFAGSFAGISNGALIVAGGANFPDGGAPWTGSKKAWTDKIFVLEKPTGKWKLAATLPQPLGYGISISHHNKLICVGGSNAGGHVATVFAMSYLNGQVEIEHWPNLPEALANSCGAVVGHTLYIADGLLVPDAKSTASVFLSMDLDSDNPYWKELQTWPGPPRMLSVAGSLNGKFYLFSGTDLEDKAGATHRKYLTDAYCYTPGKGWKKLADLPRPVVAAAGPAVAYHNNQLLIFGGDDGVLADNAATLKEKHPGFSDDILSYNTTTNKWASAGKIKTNKLSDAAGNPNKSHWAPVTTTSVLWQGALVIPGGEVRPAVRTSRVLTVKIPSSK